MKLNSAALMLTYVRVPSIPHCFGYRHQRHLANMKVVGMEAYVVDSLFELGPVPEGSHYLKATTTALFIL